MDKESPLRHYSYVPGDSGMLWHSQLRQEIDRAMPPAGESTLIQLYCTRNKGFNLFKIVLPE